MLRFGPVQVDIDAREVWLNGETQHLEPQAFDLLAYLIEHGDRVVPKEELLDQVWGDQFVSESALTTRVKEIRRATGDDGRKQSVVKNVRGRGYRFVAEASSPQDGDDGADESQLVGHANRPTRSTHQRVPGAPPTPSVGLGAEIDRLVELTETRRLVTIVGPGGVGKTRLATEVARAAAGRHVLGARIVELARISEPSALGPAIRRALDRAEGNIEAADAIGGVDALLVLDNCEHVIDAVAELLPDLLTGGDALRLVATSREPLGVVGERRWALAPLSTVGFDAPGLQLFVERALDVDVVIEASDPRVRAIASHLDGIPLALEMAAARLATMGVADLLHEVEDSVASLKTQTRGVPERHVTLRAVLAWSETLLTPEQRSTLADFSVFAGPVGAVDLPAAVESADPVTAIRALAERSLVTVDTTREASARYGSLETIRQFGRERLHDEGRFDAVRRRHATWFTEVAEAAAATYDTTEQAAAVARIDAIFDEVRAAHRWARHNDPALAMRLSSALFEPAVQQQRLEVFDWTAALVATLDDGVAASDRARLHGELALGLTFLGDIDGAREWAESAMSLAGDGFAGHAALEAMSDIHLYNGDLEQSLSYAQRHNALVEAHGSRIERAMAKANMALPLAYSGREDEALAVIPDAPPASSPPTAWAWLAYSRGEVLLNTDPNAALRELDDAIALAESVDSHFLASVAHVSAGSLRARTGSADDAVEPMIHTIERLTDRGNTTHLLTTLRNLPTLFVRLEAWRGTAELLGGLSASTISPTYGEEADRLGDAERAARSALGADVFEAAFAEGSAHSLDGTARMAAATLRRTSMRH